MPQFPAGQPEAQSMPDVHEHDGMAVAIISYNTREHLRACLDTVFAHDPAEVVVVDNGSTDGSIELLRSEYPAVRLCVNTTNPGYGAAANQAVALCRTGYVLLLNSDTRLYPGTLQLLRAYLDTHPAAAIVGPRLVNPNGTLQPSCFPYPTPLQLFLQENTLGTLLRRVPQLRDGYLPVWRHDRDRVVPWVLGAALAIRRTAFVAAGGFDPSFFMYFEEVDLCYRLGRLGWQTHFTPAAVVMHYGGASTAQVRTSMLEQYYRSVTRFYRYHYSGFRHLLLRLVLTYFMLRNMLLDSIRLRMARPGASRARIKANLPVWRRICVAQWRSRAMTASAEQWAGCRSRQDA